MTSDGRRRRASSTLSDSDGRPQWMKALLSSARNWLSLIPRQLINLRRTADNIKDPLFRSGMILVSLCLHPVSNPRKSTYKLNLHDWLIFLNSLIYWIFSFFEREVNLGVRLLSVVRSDLDEVIAVCEAKKKQTNYHRSLLSMLNKGMLPDAWNK